MPAHKYLHEFEVEGPGLFPLDMLRYDACYPATTADALAIREAGMVPGTRFQVQLRKCTETKDPEITLGRWTSFGWHTVPSSHRVTKL